MKNSWTPQSWKSKPAMQQPDYENKEELEKVVSELEDLPPIVFDTEISELRKKLQLAENGKMFIIQGGDCVERFADCNEKTILNKIKILLQMSIIITYASKIPVLKIGRIAGEYSKPRSNDFEMVNGVKIPSYRGDSINSYLPDIDERAANPLRMKESYFHAAATYNYIRAITHGGFADIRYPSKWNIDFVQENNSAKEYKNLIDNVVNSIKFIECIDGANSEILNCIDFYISHEGLLLPYEEAMTRFAQNSGEYFNLGTHMLWIGERTRDLNGAHVEYFRGISNPIGVKIGASMKPDELINLIKILNPNNESGKICLITRLGCENVKKVLPDLIKAVQDNNMNAAWICDPMHGNTKITQDGIKTRHFDDILKEISDNFEVHKKMGTFMSGVHFELTGDKVTECIGGAQQLEEKNLTENYETYCDPRLNYDQSLEISFLIAKLLKK